MDNLAGQISKLLELFEISAKALAEKNFQMGAGKGSEKIAEKIDTLLNQNKIIARGLTLMHELNAGSRPPASPYPPGENSPPAPPSGMEEGYQKSIVSGDNSGNFESPIPSDGKKLKKLPRG
jgi:hypothetical protein